MCSTPVTAGLRSREVVPRRVARRRKFPAGRQTIPDSLANAGRVPVCVRASTACSRKEELRNSKQGGRVMRLPELFDFRGHSDRSTFGLTVIFVSLVMHNLFRLVSASAASRYRSGLNYMLPLWMFLEHRPVSTDEKRLLWIMLLFAIPCLWVAVCVTVKRL